MIKLARFCRFYGTSVREALDTPVRLFFAMLAAADVIEAREALLHLDIATNPHRTESMKRLWTQLADKSNQVTAEDKLKAGRAWLQLRGTKPGRNAGPTEN